MADVNNYFPERKKLPLYLINFNKGFAAENINYLTATHATTSLLGIDFTIEKLQIKHREF